MRLLIKTMKNQMTPGPWTYAYGAVYRGGDMAPTSENAGVRIAKMDREEPHTTPTERDANTRAIALAPELIQALEACQYAMTCQALPGPDQTSEEREVWIQTTEKVRDTLAKLNA